MIFLGKEWLPVLEKKRAPRGSIPKGSFIVDLRLQNGKYTGEPKPL
ncbi:MAG: hypothetical protein M5U10_04800 [Candidatus Methanoperedens sp.]|nr:hypothetical protein [Candidatus Methanoperedens nitroreducens]MDJ1421218.1 hypothetical protein [Candidatus Methanoperedens sp.]